MSETLGTALLILRTDDTALNAGIAKAKAGADGVGTKFAQVGSKIVNTFALPVIGLGVSILKTAADFETGMNRVRALTGATGGDFAALEEQARNLGATTQFSAGEAADAMGFLAQAGFSANEIIGSMPATLNLAAAAQLDLGQTADIVSNIMTSYGLTTEETGRATDVLTATFTSSNTNLAQLGEAMKYAGSVAHGFGIKFEEAAAAMGLMGNAGYQASMAGTSLRGALIRLATPMADAAEIMKELGLNAFDSAGQMVPLVDIVRQLETSGATTTQIVKIFGQRAGPAMQALVDQGSAALAKFTTQLENSGGTAERVAKVQMEGLRGKLLELKSAWEELQLTLGDTGALENATLVVRGLTEFIRNLSGESRSLELTLLNMSIAANEYRDAFARWLGPLGNVTGKTEELKQRKIELIKQMYNVVGAALPLGDGYGYLGGQAEVAGKSVEKTTAAVADANPVLKEHKTILGNIAEGYAVLGLTITDYVLAPLKEFLATAKEIDANGYTPEGFGTGPPPPSPEQGDGSGDLFAGIGNNFAGQVAGASGAIAGFKQWGPAGAAAGFVADLLLRNEKMQELIGTLNEALVPLVDPIVDAIAPSLEAIAPILEELAPVFHLIGEALGLYLAPTAIGLGAVATGLATLDDVLRDPIGVFLERLGSDIETLLSPAIHSLISAITPLYQALLALPELIEAQIRFVFVELPQNIANGIVDGLDGLPELIADGIVDGLKDLPGDIADAVRAALPGGGGGGGDAGGTGLPGGVDFNPTTPWHSGGLIGPGELTRLPGMAADEGLGTLLEGERVIPPGRQVTIALGGDDDAFFSKRRVRAMLAALREEIGDDSTYPLITVTG